MISLPDVTVVVIDCAAHELTKLALRETLALIDPGDVLVFSDKPIMIGHIYSEHSSREDAFKTLWNRVPKYLETSHMLHIEWDGWVIEPSLWNPEWLSVDYIGAPWPWHKGSFRVGNGGFSLRSKNLMQFLDKYGYMPVHPEDDTLCRTYRPTLELQGFSWAKEQDAEVFSIEHGEFRRTFGFHDVRNWPRLLSADAISERLALANDYVKSGVAWRSMVEGLSLVH